MRLIDRIRWNMSLLQKPREKKTKVSIKELEEKIYKYKNIGRICFIKGLVKKGYTEHDVDLLIESSKSKDELVAKLDELNSELKQQFGIPLEAWVISKDKQFQWYDGDTIREVSRDSVQLWLPFKENEKICL